MTPEPSRLRPLLDPATIAVIGASPVEHGGIVGVVRGFGFGGAVFPVNPKYRDVEGYRCFGSIRDVPVSVDVALVAVRASLARQAVEECTAAGARSVILHSAGFAELGMEGAAEQEAIRQVAAAAGVPLLGPNCQGIVNVARRAAVSSNAIFRARAAMTAGDVAWVSQSGAVGGIFVELLHRHGVGVSHWVSTGNEADIDVAEIIEYFVSLPEVQVICGYVEGIRSPDRWRAAARSAVAAGKEIIVLQGGTTPQGAAASQSHTAALMSDKEAATAFLSQLGVKQANTLRDLVAACVIAVTIPRKIVDGRVVLIANSGGLGVLAADACHRLGLDVVPLGPSTLDELRRELPPYVTPGNPLDVPALIGRDPDLIRRLLRILSADDNPAEVVLMTLHSVFDADWGAAFDVEKTLAAIRTAQEDAGTTGPALVPVLLTGEEDLLARGRQLGVRAFADVDDVLQGLAVLTGSLSDRKPATGAGPENHPATPPAGRLLSEGAMKARLRAAGFRVPLGAVVSSVDDAVRLAGELGFPVVVKVSSRMVQHKSDIGAVRLNLRSSDEVAEAATAVLAAARAVTPPDAIDGLLVEKMAEGHQEMIVAIRRDPALGRTVLIGLGGLDVETYRQVAIGVLPLAENEVRSLLERSGFYSVLAGTRGRTKLDVDELVGLVSRLADYLQGEGSDITELELNPVLVGAIGEGVVILDAVAALDDSTMAAVAR